MAELLLNNFSETDIRYFIASEIANYFKKHPIEIAAKNDTDSPLTKKQAAAYLQISHVTLNRLISTRKLPCFKLGGLLRIKRSDLIKSFTAVRTNIIEKEILGNST